MNGVSVSGVADGGAVGARKGRKEVIERAVLLDDDHDMGEILTLLCLSGRQVRPARR